MLINIRVEFSCGGRCIYYLTEDKKAAQENELTFKHVKEAALGMDLLSAIYGTSTVDFSSQKARYSSR
jgi:hypothetical protein